MYRVIGYGGTRAFRLLWLLDELGVSHRHDRVMPFTEAARKAVPGGRLPGLELRDGTLLQDSTAILTFLADLHGGLTYPAGTVERARQDAWTQRVIEQVDVPLMDWTLAVQGIGPALPPEVRDWVGRGLADGFAMLAGMLPETGWVAGDRFTIADIILGHCLHWADRYGVRPDLPRLAGYFQRIEQRPSYRAADCG